MLTAMIFAKDHDALVAFYRHGLDLRVDAASSSDGYTVLVGDALRLAIHAIPAAIAAGITVTEPPQPRREVALKLLFEVTDVERTCDRLRARGARFLGATNDHAVDVADVEGNVFRVSATA